MVARKRAVSLYSPKSGFGLHLAFQAPEMQPSLATLAWASYKDFQGKERECMKAHRRHSQPEARTGVRTPPHGSTSRLLSLLSPFPFLSTPLHLLTTLPPRVRNCSQWVGEKIDPQRKAVRLVEREMYLSGVQNTLPQNTVPWDIEYFKLKGLRKQQWQEGQSDVSLLLSPEADHKTLT